MVGAHKVLGPPFSIYIHLMSVFLNFIFSLENIPALNLADALRDFL